jgi:hypothetical protein
MSDQILMFSSRTGGSIPARRVRLDELTREYRFGDAIR